VNILSGRWWRLAPPVLDHAEHHALVLPGRQLALREPVERDHEQHPDRPQHQHHRAVLEHAAQRAHVVVADQVELAIDDTGEAPLAVALAQQLRTQHRRQRQRHDARDDHRAGERERELPEQRAGEATLERDRRVHRGERDGHGDDRPDQLAGRVDRRVEWLFAQVNVPFDVLHHDDGVVHHETDREHDREQREQVDREPGRVHQEHGADERDRDRDHRDDEAADRAQEQEDHQHHDEQRLGERL
jgi:hypothetical protein